MASVRSAKPWRLTIRALACATTCKPTVCSRVSDTTVCSAADAGTAPSTRWCASRSTRPRRRSDCIACGLDGARCCRGHGVTGTVVACEGIQLRLLRRLLERCGGSLCGARSRRRACLFRPGGHERNTVARRSTLALTHDELIYRSATDQPFAAAPAIAALLTRTSPHCARWRKA